VFRLPFIEIVSGEGSAGYRRPRLLRSFTVRASWPLVKYRSGDSIAQAITQAAMIVPAELISIYARKPNPIAKSAPPKLQVKSHENPKS
jgi:hypothetical protein